MGLAGPRLSGGWGCWSVSGLSCAGWAAFSFSGSAGFSFAFLVLGSAFCSAFAAASFICAPVFLRGGAFRSTAARFSSSSSPISSCCSVSFPLIFLSSVTKLPPYDFEKVRFSVNFNRACLKTEKHLAIPPFKDAGPAGSPLAVVSNSNSLWTVRCKREPAAVLPKQGGSNFHTISHAMNYNTKHHPSRFAFSPKQTLRDRQDIQPRARGYPVIFTDTGTPRGISLGISGTGTSQNRTQYHYIQ